jgi:hypothetical protein
VEKETKKLARLEEMRQKEQATKEKEDELRRIKEARRIH